MLVLKEAKEIAEKHLQSEATGLGDDVMIIDKATIEKQYVFIFFYNTAKFLNTGDIRYALGGNCPLFISKSDGNISYFSTGFSIETMIDLYEEENKIWSLRLVNFEYS